jgi:hypothetical protein
MYADRGFAPLFTGHEPGMLLLHQSAFIVIKFFNSPVRDLHSYLPITKRVHYYYANQAKYNIYCDKYVI